jgi:hypothetical protein
MSPHERIEATTIEPDYDCRADRHVRSTEK